MNLFHHDSGERYLVRVFQQLSSDLGEEGKSVVEWVTNERGETRDMLVSLLRSSVHIRGEYVEQMGRSALAAGNVLCIQIEDDHNRDILDFCFVINNCRYPRPTVGHRPMDNA